MKTSETTGSSFQSGIEAIYESDLDDENFTSFENSGLRERRRKLHTEAEQRRRNAIKKGFDRILELLHPIKNKPNSAIRMNKSIIVQKSVSKIQKLMKLRDQKNAEYEFLEKHFLALSSFHMNYEKIYQEESNRKNTNSIPEHLKLIVFEMFADHIFSSFEPVVTVASYDVFCHSVIEWLEDSCKPERLSPLMDSVLASVFNSAIPGRPQGTSSDCPPHAQLSRFDWPDEHRRPAEANQRPMLLNDAEQLDRGQVPPAHHRPYSLPFSMSSTPSESRPLFRASSSTSSIGTYLGTSSEFAAPGQMATTGFFPHPSPSTTTTPMSSSVPGVPQNPANCPNFPAASHSVNNRLQFCLGELNSQGAAFFLDDVSVHQDQHCFYSEGPPTRGGYIQAPSSALAGSVQGDLCNSIGQDNSIPYM